MVTAPPRLTVIRIAGIRYPTTAGESFPQRRDADPRANDRMRTGLALDHGGRPTACGGVDRAPVTAATALDQAEADGPRRDADTPPGRLASSRRHRFFEGFEVEKAFVAEIFLTVPVKEYLDRDGADLVLLAIRRTLRCPHVVEHDLDLSGYFSSAFFITGCIMRQGMQLTEPISMKVTAGC